MTNEPGRQPMASLAITNAGLILSGDLTRPVVEAADSLICRDGKIAAIGP